MDLSALAQPRTIVFWIPLVLAFWVVVGLRTSLFVPSELSAAWTFHTNAPTTMLVDEDGALATRFGPASNYSGIHYSYPTMNWRLPSSKGL
jgi:hypothetical protein